MYEKQYREILIFLLKTLISALLLGRKCETRDVSRRFQQRRWLKLLISKGFRTNKRKVIAEGMLARNYIRGVLKTDL